MTIPEADSSPALTIWRGRRGNVALLVISVIALACGFGLMKFAERIGVAPACRDYAQVHGWRYVSHYTYADPIIKRSGATCTFKDEHGSVTDVHLQDISVLTDLWVSLSVNLVLTIPAFALLFAVLRTWLWKLRSAP